MSAAFLCVLTLAAFSGVAHSDETTIDEAPFISSAQVAATFASNVCSVCHGANGISTWPFVPSLAGQDKTYLENQLKAFRMRARADHYAQAAMWNIAQPLKDEEISALAEYYSSMKPPPGEPSAHSALVHIGIGKRIFENGFVERNVPACNTCHLLSGQGDENVPRVAGQHADYAAREMREYRSGFRVNNLMAFSAGLMSDAEIEAVVGYMASLNTTLKAGVRTDQPAAEPEPAKITVERQPKKKAKKRRAKASPLSP